jgi:23S rRNA (guanine2445-N2)-methyltransferase / 23S rRNA (guanine2069-N7)-methyltransferase
MSQTYLGWARRNLALNGLSEARNHLVQADCRRWLAECMQSFDLILLDPPTFSNSKRMGDDTLDIQRDHVDLVHQAMRVLSADGVLIFSNNRQRFKLDAVLEEIFAVEDFNRQSLDPDFERSPDIHRCWLIRHR